MTSPLLAMFTRSLREDSRSKATFWARAGVSGFILLLLFGFAMNDDWSGAPGRTFFIGIVILQIVSITLLGLSYFASAIAEEKEEQTLGLLRMTDLSPLSILLGKSTSRLCGALLVLIAGFPFTVFAVTLGGVSLKQIFAANCTLAAYTFLLCNVALLGSVVARNTPRAAAFSVTVLVSWIAGGPLLRLMQSRLPSTSFTSALDSLGRWLWEAAPIERLYDVLSTGFFGSPIGYQVESNLVAGVIFFFVAWAAFHRFCDRALDEAGVGGAGMLRGVRGRWRRPPRPVNNAVTWKEYHYSCGGRRGIIVRSIFYGGLLVARVFDDALDRSLGIGGMGIMLQALTIFIFSIDIAAMAVRMFRTELNDQTLSVLATLPCTIREISLRKARACLFAAAPGALSMLGGVVLNLLDYSHSTVVKPMLWTEILSTWVGLLLLVHMAVILSLTMKRGALPLSYVLTHTFHGVAYGVVGIFGGMIFSRFADFRYHFAAPWVACFFSILLAWYLHRKIPGRLEALAGEG